MKSSGPHPRWRLVAHATGLVALLGWLVGCQCRRQAVPAPPVAPADGAAALRFAGELCALGPRVSSTAGAKRAADWLAATLRAAGAQPDVDEWTEETPHGALTFRNVYATIPGRSGPFILLGSHYDTKEIAGASDFVGANDSASSTGLLLALHQQLRQPGAWAGSELRFAFFDGEECRVEYGKRDGLHGSRRLANRLQRNGEARRCRAMLLLDMVGDADLKLTIPTNCDAALSRLALAVARRQGTNDQVSFLLVGGLLDDHVPFREVGIPALDLIDFDYGPSHSYWHTRQDTMDKLSASSLTLVGNLVLGMLAEL